jgi:iron-sulfur cluster insertion protein
LQYFGGRFNQSRDKGLRIKMSDMLIITEAAKERINDIIWDEGNPNLVLRTFVQGGGCSGFQYGFTLDEEIAEDDWTFLTDPFKIVVDSLSMQYLQGSTIDYKENLEGSNFVISNPNAQSTCGCGSSFAA